MNMYRHKSKGLTLVEIILAIALMGIISVGFISVFSSQMTNIVRGSYITIDTFDNQGIFEEIIHNTKTKIQKSESLNDIPQWSSLTMSVLGVPVELQKLTFTNSNMNGKKSIIYLSDVLAVREIRNPLSVANVAINVINGDGTTDAAIADLKKTPKLKATYTDNSGQTAFYTNLYRWWRSEPGMDLTTLSFPNDFTMIHVPQSADELLNLSGLVGANSYVVLTVTPVDVHGYRGTAQLSSNMIYVKGDEWRVGAFPWVDKNNNYEYETDDHRLIRDSVLAKLDARNPYPNPFIPETTLDLSGGSLFVPMGIEPATTSEPGNEAIRVVDEGKIEWFIERNINLSKDFMVENGTDVTMVSGLGANGGSVFLHPYVKVDAGGNVELLNTGVSLETTGTVRMETAGRGSIQFLGNAEILANHIILKSRGPISIVNSKIKATSAVELNSMADPSILASRRISLVNVEFESDATGATINLKSPEDILMRGGSWSNGQTLMIEDGKGIVFEKSSDGQPVNNLGNLNLGNTGVVRFQNNMLVDLQKELKLVLDKQSNNAYKISTENYLRNIAFAGPKSNTVFSNYDQWQDLGSSQNNLEFSISKLGGPGEVEDIKFDFNGGDLLRIEKNTSDQRAQTRIKIQVRDKYAFNSIVGIGVFNYTIDSSGTIVIEIDDDFETIQTISIPDIQGVSVPLPGQTPTTILTSNVEYTGTITWSPSDNPFQGNKIYTATISISPNEGYTLTGVPENFFTLNGATSVSNAVNNGVVTAVFPKTPFTDISLGFLTDSGYNSSAVNKVYLGFKENINTFDPNKIIFTRNGTTIPLGRVEKDLFDSKVLLIHLNASIPKSEMGSVTMSLTAGATNFISDDITNIPLPNTAIGDVAYRIYARHTENLSRVFYLEHMADGYLRQKEWQNDPKLKWSFEGIGGADPIVYYNLTDKTYMIRPYNSSGNMSLENLSGVDLKITNGNNNNNNQRAFNFQFVSGNNGYYHIVSSHLNNTYRYLDISGGTNVGVDGLLIAWSDFHKGLNQQFRIQPIINLN